MKKIIIFALISCAAILLGSVIFIWAGVYNIAATEKHWGITTSLITWLRERSIAVRADRVPAPPALDKPELIAEGAAHYAAMCTGCHLAPGMEASELHQGLYPRPPVFYQAEEHAAHNPKATFWAIKNGIKLTGMPAWGASHSDEAIWGLVAFIEQLPGMSADKYRQLTVNSSEHQHSHGDEPASGTGETAEHMHEHEGGDGEAAAKADEAATHSHDNHNDHHEH